MGELAMPSMQKDRARISLAAAISMTLCSAQVLAQDARRTELEEVIVTGTLIEGTPEDTALPVEVMTLEDFDNLGRPSAIDLVKTMSEVGQVAGEADRSNTFPIGTATVNLRNLGSRYTTVIFNGRRFPEQFGPGLIGRFNNIAWIPQAAIGRIEVLKQGGAVTYGADAMGGVVNYITRKGFTGLELNADYRYIEDSDGDYSADVVWGSRFDRGDVLLVAGYQKRNTLMARDREWTQRHYLENNNPWSAAGSPGAYQFQTLRSASVTLGSAIAAAQAVGNINRYVGDRQSSATGGLMRDPYCTELGGFAGWNGTPSPVCYFNEAGYEKLVEEQDTYQFYGEFNYKLTDSLELHSELTYNEIDMPDISMSPSSSVLGSFPQLRDAQGNPQPGRQTGAGLVGSAVGAYWVPGNHPAVRPLMDAMLNSDGSPTFTEDQVNAITDPTQPGRIALITGTWRPFGAGGHPTKGLYDTQHNNTKMWRATLELKGELPKFWGTDLSWSIAGTYSKVDYLVEARDILVDRLQAALNGLGGPNCTGSTPGANGCQWFNPFSSAIPRNVYTGQANPGYIPSLANDPALVEWLYVPIWLDRDYKMYVGDLLVSGTTGWNLPGGPVAIALGAQFRRSEELFVLDPLSNQDLNPCPTIGATNCTNRTGPLAMSRNTTILGTTQNVDRHYPVAAAFFETQLPLHDTLTLQLAGRWEKFYSDLTDVDNEVFVPAGAIKWQPLDQLAFRFSAGRTFSQVNPPLNDGPTETNSAGNTAFGGFGDASSQYRIFNYDNVDVKSEESTYFNVGFITQIGDFTATVDYWENWIEKGVRTLTTDNILRALIMPGETPSRSALINCSSPLLQPVAGLRNINNPDDEPHPVVQLNGDCVQGTSRLDSPAGEGGLVGGQIHYFGGFLQVNGGELNQSGIDLNLSYRIDLFGGTLRPSLDLTYYLKYKYEDFKLFGVTVAEGYDGLGYTNTSSGRNLQAVPEFRGSIGLLYNHGRHTVNLLGRYMPRIKNDNFEEISRAQSATNANIAGPCPASGPLTSDLGDVPAGAGSAEFGAFCANMNTSLLSFKELKASYNFDLTYRVELPQDMQMSLSIYNLTNARPEFSRSQLSYSAYFGSPLERNFRVTFRKRF